MSFWKSFWGPKPKELFLKFDPQDSAWRVVTWNFDLDGPSKRQWTVEVQGKNGQIIHWQRQKHDELHFFEGARLIKKQKNVETNKELMTLMNISLHSTLKYSIEVNHPFMLLPVSGATHIDIQNEGKSLQWIQASFGTLIRALDNVKKNPDMILTAACFSGRVPDGQDDVLRVIAFNLDIFFYLRPDGTLQIAIFDDKNLGQGKTQTPVFQQIIKVTKPQFYDEITKLIHRIAEVGEIA